MSSDDSLPPVEAADAAAEPVAAVETSAVVAAEVPAEAAPAVAPQAANIPAMSPSACAQQLKALFPALFAGAAKPLKLRIQADIQERAPGQFSKQVLSAFFRRYTGSTSYLIAASKAKHRYDLDGAEAGEMSEEHRQIAVQELARRRANHEAARAQEMAQHAQEEEQRRNRFNLLRAFETTTLTPANFCALKGVAMEELDGLLALARQEAAQRASQAPAPQRSGPPGNREQREPRGDNRGPRADQRPGQRPGGPRPAGPRGEPRRDGRPPKAGPR
ncbi:MAG: ProQ/FinO family protein [Burkholderiaceae bacterium]|nr:ProQ/FinO family protein [Burkholderiaceae bacterium]